MLLNVGPTSDGVIIPIMEVRNEEAIHKLLYRGKRVITLHITADVPSKKKSKNYKNNVSN